MVWSEMQNLAAVDAASMQKEWLEWCSGDEKDLVEILDPERSGHC